MDGLVAVSQAPELHEKPSGLLPVLPDAGPANQALLDPGALQSLQPGRVLPAPSRGPEMERPVSRRLAVAQQSVQP